MGVQKFAVLLAFLASMLFASYILRFGLEKLRMPSLLAPLFIGFLFQIFPLTTSFTNIVYEESFDFLVQLGIIFLLFLVGLRLDVSELRGLSLHLIMLAILNLVFSTLLGFLILLHYGYPPLISLVVSTALATVAETTIAPILDELGVIKTRVVSMILGPGVIDDVAEDAIASLASLIVGTGEEVAPSFLAFGLLAFMALVIVFHKLILPLTARFSGKMKDQHLFIFMVFVALFFTSVSQYFRLGILLGAMVAGLMFQGFLKFFRSRSKVLAALTLISYGFLGPIFFFGIGLSVDLSVFAESLQLTIWLLLANFIGKFLASFMVGRMLKLNLKAIIAVGLGLSAKFSMGIIPVQIFYSAKLIDPHLFSAFIAVSAITTLIIPASLSYLINRWKESII